jgi:hypothetical protein
MAVLQEFEMMWKETAVAILRHYAGITIRIRNTF